MPKRRINTQQQRWQPFFSHLRKDCPKTLFNPWFEQDRRYDLENGADRRHQNLQWYLTTFAPAAKVLFLGEAAGYGGCRFSGIPFTDEFWLQHQPWQTPFQQSSKASRPYKEASGTCVRQVLNETQQPVLLWNVLPWHPRQPRRPLSNRTPTAAELETGRDTLIKLLQVMPRLEHVVGIGRKAQTLLEKWDVELPQTYIRHPSHGGAKIFRAQTRQLLQSLL